MALRISRRVCTLGRPRALGAGTKGSMWNHSASDKSVWYALLMLGTLPSHYLRTPFRTVSEELFSETHIRHRGDTGRSFLGNSMGTSPTYGRERQRQPLIGDSIYSFTEQSLQKLSLFLPRGFLCLLLNLQAFV